jgi:dTDP-glucose pyrophosphorylase
MWGIIPAAGLGSRIQPLAFSKELLPVGSRADEGVERPRAVSEYLVERMLQGGANRICFVISPLKSDIIRYFGESYGDARICYVVQSKPAGLCDALFQAMPFIEPHEQVMVGLPDTVWFPEDPGTRWIWGAFKLNGAILRSLHHLWIARGRRDEYFGTLVNAFLSAGGNAVGIRAGEDYVDVGTLHGYREAIRLLEKRRAGFAGPPGSGEPIAQQILGG